MTPDANGKVAFDGLELTFTGTPAVNDSFTLKPVSDAIVNMDVLITDEAKIAMASEEDAGDSDNRNGQALLDLQSNSKTVGGAKSFNDAYASLVSDIGNKTATLKTSSTTQGNVVTQLSISSSRFPVSISMRSTEICNVFSSITRRMRRFCRRQTRFLMR